MMLLRVIVAWVLMFGVASAATISATPQVPGALLGTDKVPLGRAGSATAYTASVSAIAEYANGWKDVRNYASLAAAVTAIGSTPATLQYSTDQTLAANLTVPANIELMPMNGAVINHTTYTISYAGSIERWPLAQIFNGTGAVTGLNLSRPEWFGINTVPGTTDMSSAIAKMSASSTKWIFSNTTYRMNTGVTKAANNVDVDFGSAKFINGGAGYLFTFGTQSDTPLYSGLKTSGGYFEQADPSTVNNLNYILVASMKDFLIKDPNMKNVSNGGIVVYAGSENGTIENPVINGRSGYATCRGIWLNGATSSDFAAQLVDTTSITRNATAVPVYAVKNVKILNPNIVMDGYGVYLINSQSCKVVGGYIDISGSGADRCIAINNYSPDAEVTGVTLTSDRSSTGILITQYSQNVLIKNNRFKGSFGGNRDIYIQYLAQAVITGNVHSTDSTQQVQIDMGGSAVIRGNDYSRSAYAANTRVLRIDTIDAAVAGTGTYGDTATLLPGTVFENNVVRVRNVPVYINTLASTSGNVPGLEPVTVRNNVFYNMNTAATTDEYGMRIYANGTTNTVSYQYFGNIVYPSANANRNSPNVTGAGFVALRTDFQLATFRISNAAGGGAVTSTKLWGGNFSCAASRSGDAMLISPRTISGGAGASVAPVLSVVDAAGTSYKYDIVASGSSYAIRIFGSTGVQIMLSTTAATFDVTVAHSSL